MHKPERIVLASDQTLYPAGGAVLKAEVLVQGTHSELAPEEGASPEGREGWQRKHVEFDEGDAIRDRGTYLYVPIESEAPAAVFLQEQDVTRPYGFDWEDFGRMDAMEVLTIAQRTLEHDPSRTGVSSEYRWLAIEARIHHMDLSKAHVQSWLGKRRFKRTTENVAILGLDVDHLLAHEPITVELDGQRLAEIPCPEKSGGDLARTDCGWVAPHSQTPADP